MAFVPADQKQVVLRVLAALAGPTGSGKTYSAMQIASGICGSDPFAVIDTESNRALHYRDDFRFDHDSIEPPFRPCKYTEKIKEAASSGYKAVVIDSGSHEHAGDGGLLDWHEEELDRMAGPVPEDPSIPYNWKKREACGIASWIKPKKAHKDMIQQLLRAEAQAVIMCMRAEEKMEMIADPKSGKMMPRSAGWKMITEKKLPYEFTFSLMMNADAPGTYSIIKMTKNLQQIFDKTRITSDIGRKIVEWSTGGQQPNQTQDPVDNALGLIASSKTLEELKSRGAKIGDLDLKGNDKKRVELAWKSSFSVLSKDQEET